ncbi:MAG: twin-arginine translocase TatA/TatE family subunit [Eggerthellaceae bacterium]|nr:twin-arginine translocase TatA/TatE family subunit [Eggerthellaceae bacterium]
MFGIGGFELFLIVLFAFMLFGPEKIPAFLKTLRKALVKFREAEQEVSSVLKQEVIDPETGETAADVLDSLTGKSTSASKKTVAGESFAARKARYEQEKAEREKREREKAEQAKAASELVDASEKEASSDAGVDVVEDNASKKVAESSVAGVSIEELYSMKPVDQASPISDEVVAETDEAEEATIEASSLVEVVADVDEEA